MTITINEALLAAFEAGLDPRHPEHSAIPARVLGYGEISTVLSIETPEGADLAFKRLALFRRPAEVDRYMALYERYVAALGQAGIRVVPSRLVRLPGEGERYPVYIVQERLPAHSLAHQLIRRLDLEGARRLFLAVLLQIDQVAQYNQAQQGRQALGFDAQLSNWAVDGLNEAGAALPETLELVYIDTSSPLLRQNGVEQSDPELFLRSAPSFMVWIIRRLFLQDVLTRYYDPRQVIVDVIANLYKEQRPDLVAGLVGAANEFLAARPAGANAAPFTVREIRSYYREDAFIWRFYLTARRLDRWLHQLTGRPYPFVLPGPTRR